MFVNNGRLYRICFRTSDLNKHFWENKSEYLLGSGSTLGEAEKQAYQTWLAKIVTTDKPYTMGSLFDRYQQQIIPKKSKSSIESNTISLTRLRLAIDLNQPVVTFEPHQAFAYRDYVHTHFERPNALTLTLNAYLMFSRKQLSGDVKLDIRSKASLQKYLLLRVIAI